MEVWEYGEGFIEDKEFRLDFEGKADLDICVCTVHEGRERSEAGPVPHNCRVAHSRVVNVYSTPKCAVHSLQGHMW